MDVVKTVCDSAALMESGRIVESGTVSELLATPGSELASALFPVGGEAADADRTVVDVTFQGEAATQPVISQLSRTYNIDISILGAASDTVGGLPLGILLVLTDRGGLLQNVVANKVIGQIVNVARSMPFIILMVALMTFTRWITGTTIGREAAIVPLAIGAIPFFARLVETA